MEGEKEKRKVRRNRGRSKGEGGKEEEGREECYISAYQVTCSTYCQYLKYNASQGVEGQANNLRNACGIA